jgi:hypothetical protein
MIFSISHTHRLILVSVGLLLLIGIVFGQCLNFDFVRLDDAENIIEQKAVTSGISLKGVAWAFTHTQVFRWSPLTTLSRQLDCQMFGLNAGMHHLTNLLIHASTTVLLFLVLESITGGLLPSALVAAIFAIHPLHVEPVEWLSARGELLATLFAVFTIGTYVRYTKSSDSRWNYLAVLLFFLFAMLCKQSLVTLPVVLLLLDYWPLRRMKSGTTVRHLLLEKVPLLLIAILGSAVGLLAQRGMTDRWGEALPMFIRVGNGAVFLCYYLWKTTIPIGLSFYYPPVRLGYPVWLISLSFLLLLSVSFLAIRMRKKAPYFLAGWFWFLIMMLPMIGIIHTGSGAHPDRYDYLPMVGILITAVWSSMAWSKSSHFRKRALFLTASGIVATLVPMSKNQAATWKNEETLLHRYQVCVEKDPGNHKRTGTNFLSDGDLDGALKEFRAALSLDPENPKTMILVAQLLSIQGATKEASDLYRKILVIDPDDAEIHFRLAFLLAQDGNNLEALSEIKKSIIKKPRNKKYQNFFESLNNKS